MGNVAPAPKTITLSKTGRPVILFSAKKTPGRVFFEKLTPLDRKNSSFASKDSSGTSTWRLPATWDGSKKGSPDGSIVSSDGKPVWKLEQIWPPDPRKPQNYRAMTWNGTAWNVSEGGMGGQPGAGLKDGALKLETRAAHGTPPQRRYCALVFVAPQTASYKIYGTVSSRIWDGKNKTTLRLLRKNPSDAAEITSTVIAHEATAQLDTTVQLNAGDELVLLPEIEGMYAGGDLTFHDFEITSEK